MVVVNLSHKSHQAYRLGFPMGSNWRVRFNSDSNRYSTYSSNTTCNTANAAPRPVEPVQSSPSMLSSSRLRDGFQNEGLINIGPYSVLTLPQDKV
ncbi:MAG: alpha amylase C-terminal domain-containing protein [Pirellula sp.]|nr:alpha amylase C-terminal domain-containing protein [Pirellula sp.]